MAFPENEDRGTLPTLVTRVSLTFKKMTIFFAGGLSLTFLDAGASEGNGTRCMNVTATVNGAGRRVGLSHPLRNLDRGHVRHCVGLFLFACLVDAFLK